VLNEEINDDVVAVVAMLVAVTFEYVNLDRMDCRDTPISCIAAKSLKDHSRHADLKKVSSL
jgi:hypothetical protein